MAQLHHHLHGYLRPRIRADDPLGTVQGLSDDRHEDGGIAPVRRLLSGDGATGAILYATSQFLPLLVQTDFGYTATWAGVLLTPGGLVTMVMMFVVGNLSSRFQPKHLIMVGAIFCAISMYQLTNVYGDLDFWFFARTRMVLGIGLPLIFIPIITASYDGIPANRVDMASALINAARNTGGSIGVSSPPTCLITASSSTRVRLIEHAIPSSQQYQNTLHQMTNYFLVRGSLLPEAQQQAFNWIGQQVQAQSSFLAYMDVFWVLTLLSLAAVPLALSLRKVKLGGAVPQPTELRASKRAATAALFRRLGGSSILLDLRFLVRDGARAVPRHRQSSREAGPTAASWFGRSAVRR